MTTFRSPLSILTAQARKIAQVLLAASRGERVPGSDQVRFSERKESVQFAVAMDDRIVVIDMPWDAIRDSGEVAMAEYVLKRMKGSRDAEH